MSTHVNTDPLADQECKDWTAALANYTAEIAEGYRKMASVDDMDSPEIVNLRTRLTKLSADRDAIKKKLEVKLSKIKSAAEKESSKTVKDTMRQEAITSALEFIYTKNVNGSIKYYLKIRGGSVTLKELPTADEHTVLGEAMASIGGYPELQSFIDAMGTYPSSAAKTESSRKREFLSDLRYAAIQNIAHTMKDPCPVSISMDPAQPALCHLIVDIQPGPYPAWEEFLTRLDNPKAFSAWIYSLLDPDSTIRAAMWLMGNGQDGKSTIISVLYSFLDQWELCTTKDGDMAKDSFNTGDLPGKRLITIPDCKNRYIIQDELVHKITGSDKIWVNKKNVPGYSASIDAKILIGSNYPPQVDDEENETSRVLPIVIKRKSPNRTGNCWKTELTEQLPAFLHYARECYESRLSADKGHILPDTGGAWDLTQYVSSDYEVMASFVAEYPKGRGKMALLSDVRSAFAEYLKEKHVSGSVNYMINRLARFLNDESKNTGFRIDRKTFAGRKLSVVCGLGTKTEDQLRASIKMKTKEFETETDEETTEEASDDGF